MRPMGRASAGDGHARSLQRPVSPRLVDFLLAAHVLGTLPGGAAGARPRTEVVFQFLDTPADLNLYRQRALTADLAAFCSFVSRVGFNSCPRSLHRWPGIPDRLTFVPYDDVFDRRIEAPIDGGFQAPIDAPERPSR